MKKDSQEIHSALHDKSSAMLMLDNKERKLLKEILALTLKSQSARTWIAKKLGNEYIKIGEKLLKTMGGL
ncbi:MAG: hypothetical protein JSW56_17735 [Deltaproteobacteria bacterium]|jgi:hypothetical protein|nr:MAG: hypothetical protein JSW56_17735 [Deltaproteobacteria bacterium]